MMKTVSVTLGLAVCFFSFPLLGMDGVRKPSHGNKKTNTLKAPVKVKSERDARRMFKNGTLTAGQYGRALRLLREQGLKRATKKPNGVVPKSVAPKDVALVNSYRKKIVDALIAGDVKTASEFAVKLANKGGNLHGIYFTTDNARGLDKQKTTEFGKTLSRDRVSHPYMGLERVPLVIKFMREAATDLRRMPMPMHKFVGDKLVTVEAIEDDSDAMKALRWLVRHKELLNTENPEALESRVTQNEMGSPARANNVRKVGGTWVEVALTWVPWLKRDPEDYRFPEHVISETNQNRMIEMRRDELAFFAENLGAKSTGQIRTFDLKHRFAERRWIGAVKNYGEPQIVVPEKFKGAFIQSSWLGKDVALGRPGQFIESLRVNEQYGGNNKIRSNVRRGVTLR